MNKIVKLIRFIVAWFRIPKGMYCYFEGRSEPCPYWRLIKGRPFQANGWCNYLGKGDLEIVEETEWVNSKTGDKISGSELPGSSLLWDQCKECGIKDE